MKKKHLAPVKPNLDHASLCNVKARRWEGGRVVRTKPAVVDLATFRALKLSEQCGRCFLKLCAREGTPVKRQR